MEGRYRWDTRSLKLPAQEGPLCVGYGLIKRRAGATEQQEADVEAQLQLLKYKNHCLSDLL